MMESTNGKAAAIETPEQLAAGGVSVIPIKTDGTKRPRVVAWKPFQSRIADRGELASMFRGRRGVAVICGQVSGGLEAIDFDDFDTFEQFVPEIELVAPGLLDRLTQVKTPRPGRRLVYRCSIIAGNQTLANVPGVDGEGRTKPKTIIETRGEGGYILAPGCPPECHPSGRTYEHVSGPPLSEAPTITPEERETLFTVARSFNRWIEPADVEQGPSQRRTDGNSPGDEFNQRATWEEILEPAGWVKCHASGNRTYWRRPGKDKGWSATTGVRSQAGTELFCCFSSNAYPFEGANGSRPCSSYSKFAAYTVLKHGGDYSAAARALASEGYGSPPRNHNGQAGSTQQQADGRHTKQLEPPTYQLITSRELDAAEYSVEYLIDRTLVAGQPCVVAGGKKNLKTSIIVDMAVSLSVGGFFLGKLPVSRACRVLVMSGESGLPTLQETARRIAKQAGHELGHLDNLIWSPDLPRFGDLAHLDAFEGVLLENEIEVVFIDPAYMAMPGGDAGNLFVQGELLQGVTRTCQKMGVTLALAHHTRKGGKVDPFSPPELEDIAWAGFQEWARQWLLLSRRERYEPGSGLHRLWLSVGGSAGHSALWGVDIAEGVYDGVSERYWHVDVMKAEDVQEDHEKRKETTKADREYERRERNMKTILSAVLSCDGERGTKTEIRERSGLSGTAFNPAWGELLKTRAIVAGEMVKKSNGKSYQTYATRQPD